jgi:leader peptidase (prepilin peptidase) / N-methyltransferase
MTALTVALSVPLGLVIGALLNVVVERVPGRAPLFVRQRCASCERHLPMRRLVPVVSWAPARRRCGHCGARFDRTGPVVEVTTAAGFALAAARFGPSWELLPMLVLVAALVAVSAVDLAHYRIPDRIVFPSLAVSIVAISAISVADGSPGAIGDAATGAVFFAAVLLVAAILTRGGIGLGDVKLALLLGLFIGWIGGDLLRTTRLVLIALVIGSVLGAVVGLVLGAVRRATGRAVLPDPLATEGDTAGPHWTKQTFPFGPALAVGTLAVVLVADGPFVG